MKASKPFFCSSFQAVESLNGLEMGGKLMYAGRAQKRAERQSELKDKFEKIKMERINRYQGVNLYVKNLDDVIDDERLRKEFSQFGTITSARVRIGLSLPVHQVCVVSFITSTCLIITTHRYTVWFISQRMPVCNLITNIGVFVEYKILKQVQFCNN